jgi:hypothetical protein
MGDCFTESLYKGAGALPLFIPHPSLFIIHLTNICFVMNNEAASLMNNE